MAIHFEFTLNDVDAMNFLMTLNYGHNDYDVKILQAKSELIRETLRSHKEYLGKIIDVVSTGEKVEDSDNFNI